VKDVYKIIYHTKKNNRLDYADPAFMGYSAVLPGPRQSSGYGRYHSNDG
jgi:hypothetical protein